MKTKTLLFLVCLFLTNNAFSATCDSERHFQDSVTATAACQALVVEANYGAGCYVNSSTQKWTYTAGAASRVCFTWNAGCPVTNTAMDSTGECTIDTDGNGVPDIDEPPPLDCGPNYIDDNGTCRPDPLDPPEPGSVNPNTGGFGGVPTDPDELGEQGTTISTEGQTPNNGGSFTGQSTNGTTVGSTSDSIIDSAGNLWEKQGGTICEGNGSICTSEYAQTDTVVDPNDPNTWPSGAVGYDDGIFGYQSPGDTSWVPGDAGYTDPFANPNLVQEYIIDNDTSISTSPGSSTTTDSSTKLTTDGSKVTTKTTTTTNDDGTSTVKTDISTKTADNTTTTSTTTFYDGLGGSTITDTFTGTDQGSDEFSEGSASGGLSCDVAPSCKGDELMCMQIYQQWKTRCGGDEYIPSEHTAQTVANFGEAMDNFSTALDAAPLIQGFNNIASVANGTGECPVFSVDLTGTIIGEVISTSLHCDTAEVIRPIVSPLMLITFAIAGFRIVASA